MYQFGTKPQPPMKSGEECAWVAATTMSSCLRPSVASPASSAAICLIPQSSHFEP